MKVLEARTQTHDFLNFVATKKRKFSDWTFLHIMIHNESEELKIDEVIQVLGFQFPDNNTLLLKFQSEKEIILVTNNNNNKALSLIDRAVYENFSSHMLRTTTCKFQDSTLPQFTKFLSKNIPQTDTISQINLKRIARTTNCILIVDDDEMVLRQMEKMLIGFGTVIAIQDPRDFIERYREYCPDIVFLDIHMPFTRGPNILQVLRDEVDPYAYVIMISSDSNNNVVMEIKEKGAQGFVVKPLNRDKLYKCVLKTPSFNPKKVSKGSLI